MITALQARQIAIEGKEKRLEAAIEEIKLHAQRGYFSCLLLGGISEELCRSLRILGYGIEDKQCDTVRVTWEDK